MKVLIITGASKGIGLATAERFLQEGYYIINISRAKAENRDINCIKLDLSLPFDSKIFKEYETVLEKAEQIVLMHNAAFHVLDNVTDAEPENLLKSWQVNITAPTLLNQILLPFMSAGSAIIYIGSTLSEKAVANAYTYSIAKHATAGMMRATCQDLVGKAIHTCCICPGLTDTEMLKQHLSNNAALTEKLQNLSSYKRFVEPGEIAELAYQCSQSAVINGSIIHANLGQIER